MLLAESKDGAMRHRNGSSGLLGEISTTRPRLGTLIWMPTLLMNGKAVPPDGVWLLSNAEAAA